MSLSQFIFFFFGKSVTIKASFFFYASPFLNPTSFNASVILIFCFITFLSSVSNIPMLKGSTNRCPRRTSRITSLWRRWSRGRAVSSSSSWTASERKRTRFSTHRPKSQPQISAWCKNTTPAYLISLVSSTPHTKTLVLRDAKNFWM